MISISNQEAKEILISVVAISLALAINQVGVLEVPGNLPEFAKLSGFFLVALGSGFILHELAHKFTAIKFGYYARFRMWLQGLGFMFLLAIIPTKLMFIAPGAVYIGSPGKKITKRENGIISLAGPAMNMVIATLAIAAYLVFGPAMMDAMGGVEMWSSIAWINTFLALFNMLPIFPLDGSKVLAWNSLVYMVFGAIVLLFFFMV